jgi:diketogulonate reductase-like aldo/keto reductase
VKARARGCWSLWKLGAVSRAEGDDIAPIPGTKRVSRVEENTAADAITLSTDRLQRLNDLTPATGARHNEANMAAIDG